MKVDDKKMQAFRNQGKTPTLTSSPYGEGELIRGELKHDLIKPTSMSPMSQRSGMAQKRIGYLGAA